MIIPSRRFRPVKHKSRLTKCSIFSRLDTPYMSKVTHQQEWSPVAIGVVSVKGSDIDSVERIEDMVIETGIKTQVEVGGTSFQVTGDYKKKRFKARRCAEIFTPLRPVWVTMESSVR